MELTLIETKQVNNISVDGYYGESEAWFTREQIGQALEYSNPRKAIKDIHMRHKERLDMFSREGAQFAPPSGRQEGYVYNRRGVFEICRWSRQPKADIIMDALYDMAEEVIKKGYFSLMPDEQLVQMITERQRLNPTTLDLIDKTKIKNQLKQETRAERQKETDDLWVQFFGKHEEVDMPKEIRRIWRDDMPMYHKYLDKYHADVKKQQKCGYIITT